MSQSPQQRPSETANGNARETAGWRIDDLARRADCPVDTIRYYQREGLLPPAERVGRANIYSPAHLERLERIKELQARRFSLAAIKALLSAEREGLVEGIFGGGGDRRYTLDELLERSGLDPELARDVQEAGLLRDPADYGRDAYDNDDLDYLRTLAGLRALGLPEEAVITIAKTYAEGIEAVQRKIIDLFTTGGDLHLSDDELTEFQDSTSRNASQILPLARRLVDYTHQRTIQRLTLGAIEREAAESGD